MYSANLNAIIMFGGATSASGGAITLPQRALNDTFALYLGEFTCNAHDACNRHSKSE